jgi:FKBP-type peptidyl-prolyl cis-trans isomerase
VKKGVKSRFFLLILPKIYQKSYTCNAEVVWGIILNSVTVCAEQLDIVTSRRTAEKEICKEFILKARIYLLVLVAGLLSIVSVQAEEEKAVAADAEKKDAVEAKKEVFKNDGDKVSYAIGLSIAQNMKQQGVEINLEMMVRAMQDVFEGKEPLLSQEQIQEVMMNFQKTMMEKRKQQEENLKKGQAFLEENKAGMEKRKQQGEENLKKGQAFLEENKAKEGITTLPSGLQYKVITEGAGKTPTADDKVKTHYRGTLIDGTEFDSSYKKGEPAEFPVKGVIRGWTEALQLMKEGAKWQLFIPSELAYGERGSGGSVPGNAVLIFEIELLEILPKTPPKAQPIEIK